MKTVTKYIDYTGCHPDIAAALKQGHQILCSKSGKKEFTYWVTGFVAGDDFPYKVSDNTSCRDVIPVPKPEKEYQVVDVVSFVTTLTLLGYIVDRRGYFVKNTEDYYAPHVLFMCGQIFPENEISKIPGKRLVYKGDIGWALPAQCFEEIDRPCG